MRIIGLLAAMSLVSLIGCKEDGARPVQHQSNELQTLVAHYEFSVGTLRTRLSSKAESLYSPVVCYETGPVAQVVSGEFARELMTQQGWTETVAPQIA